jgi:hypothetical protein
LPSMPGSILGIGPRPLRQAAAFPAAAADNPCPFEIYLFTSAQVD